MSIDPHAAERFVLSNARLLDRRRLACLLHGDPVEPVLDALRAYANSDGGFGHALEPDVRGPESEPASTLRALEVLHETGMASEPMVGRAAAWLATISDADGGVPFVTAAAASYPHAPWMVPSESGSFLTFACAALLLELGSGEPWLAPAIDWCWRAIDDGTELGAYGVKFALVFLDAVPDEQRALARIADFRDTIDADGSLPVPGGTDGERITPLDLSPRPGARSRTLFTDAQIEADLDRLGAGQRDDGGWMFDWLGWSPGQVVEWRGTLTVNAIATLLAHGRMAAPQR